MKYNFDEKIVRLGTNAYKYDRLKEFCGSDDVTPMWVADMDFATPPFVLQAIQKRLSQQILGYTCTTDAYYDSIVAWCQSHYDWTVTREQISYVPGVVCGIYLAMQVFTEKGDKILIQDPVYHPFRIVPETSEREIVWNHLVRTEDSFEMDLEALRRDLKGCKMMILCNPHNPAGICWSRETLQQVAHICAEEGVVVVSDEIHCDMLLDGRKHIPFATVSEEARRISITLQAPSKTFNMPGVVCSHAIIPNDEMREKYFYYIDESDMTLGNVFTYDCAAACYSDEGDEWRKQMLEYVQGNVKALVEGLAPIQDKVRVIRPEASFLVFLDCRGLGFTTAEEYMDFFANKCHLGLNPGNMFGPGGLGYMRMNVGCPRSLVDEAIACILKAVSEL